MTKTAFWMTMTIERRFRCITSRMLIRSNTSTTRCSILKSRFTDCIGGVIRICMTACTQLIWCSTTTTHFHRLCMIRVLVRSNCSVTTQTVTIKHMSAWEWGLIIFSFCKPNHSGPNSSNYSPPRCTTMSNISIFQLLFLAWSTCSKSQAKHKSPLSGSTTAWALKSSWSITWQWQM